MTGAMQPGPPTFIELGKHRHRILELARRRGAGNVRVFGSVARGVAGQASDVDLLVELEPDRSLLDLAGLKLDLEELLGCPVDVLTDAGLKPRLLSQVARTARPL